MLQIVSRQSEAFSFLTNLLSTIHYFSCCKITSIFRNMCYLCLKNTRKRLHFRIKIVSLQEN